MSAMAKLQGCDKKTVNGIRVTSYQVNFDKNGFPLALSWLLFRKMEQVLFSHDKKWRSCTAIPNSLLNSHRPDVSTNSPISLLILPSLYSIGWAFRSAMFPVWPCLSSPVVGALDRWADSQWWETFPRLCKFEPPRRSLHICSWRYGLQLVAVAASQSRIIRWVERAVSGFDGRVKRSNLKSAVYPEFPDWAVEVPDLHNTPRFELLRVPRFWHKKFSNSKQLNEMYAVGWFLFSMLTNSSMRICGHPSPP